MSRRIARRIRGIVPLAAALVLLVAGSASAAEFWLRAEQVDQTMPDGRVVPMWGFALDADQDFGTIDGTATVPGPALVLAPGDHQLTVHLYNRDIPDSVSVIIPGQAAPTDGIDPNPQVVRNMDTQGNWRATSFTHNVLAGFQKDYVWTSIRPGTYLYQSGTHPAVQVQMGLYGALVHDDAAGNAYGDPVSAYDQDLVLLYSEIDPALHDAVAGGQYGPGLAVTSTAHYDPRYFLVNGKPFAPGNSPLPIGTSGTTLLRFLNAGLETHLPALGGGPSLTVISEDGNLLPYVRVAQQVELHAGQTVDATLDLDAPVAPGYYPLYDRKLSLTNDRAPDGGMLVYLDVPGASTQTLTVAPAGTGTGTIETASAPGGISCGADCAESYNTGTVVKLKAVPAPGSVFAGWSGGGCTGTGDCVATMSADQSVTATFTALTAVRLLTPIAGETIPSGSIYPISWAAPTTAVSFRLFLSYNGGVTWSILAPKIVGLSEYAWRVPIPATNLTRCRVRILAFNAAGRSVGISTSGLFTIEVVRLVAPNGGEVLTGGTVFPISWETNATRAPVTTTRLYWSANNGLSWALIAAIPGNPGVYDWTVPTRATALTNVRFRVVLFAPTVAGIDVSNARSTIVPGP